MEKSRPCCTACNLMKADLKWEDFHHHVSSIAHHNQCRPSEDLCDLPAPCWQGKVRKLMKITGPGGETAVFPGTRIHCGDRGDRPSWGVLIPRGETAGALD